MAIAYSESISRACETRPIHVLTLTPFYPHKGDDADGCFVAEPLEHLPKFNILSTVIAAKPVSHLSFKSSDCFPEATWVRHRQLPGRAAYGSWGLLIYARLFRHAARLHRKHPVDIIHAHAALPCGHPAALLSRDLRVPFIVTTHGLDVFSRRRERGLSRWWCDRVSRFVYKAASQNICVSRAVSREIVKILGDSAKTAVVYNGVDTEMFAPPTDVGGDSNATILSVGRLVPDKGQDVVLRAVARLVGQHPTIRYEMIDDGPDQDRLLALAKQLSIADRIVFAGRMSRKEVAEAMKRCAVFALPSRDEALGCVYLEAMATAKPVIACRNQGIEEIIRHGENGWLIEPGSVDQMAQVLSNLLASASLRERLGREARRTTVESLTLAHQAERLNEVYRQCLEQAAGS